MPEVRFGLAVVAVVAALLAAGALGLPGPLTTGLSATVAALTGLGLSLRWRLGTGLLAWALVTGFAVNAHGQLTFTGPDLVRLGAILAGCAVVAGAVRRLGAR